MQFKEDTNVNLNELNEDRNKSQEVQGNINTQFNELTKKIQNPKTKLSKKTEIMNVGGCFVGWERSQPPNGLTSYLNSQQH